MLSFQVSKRFQRRSKTMLGNQLKYRYCFLTKIKLVYEHVEKHTDVKLAVTD